MWVNYLDNIPAIIVAGYGISTLFERENRLCRKKVKKRKGKDYQSFFNFSII